MTEIIAGLVGFLIVGLSLGLLGGGGSILAVPVLVHALGIPASTAVPMSLPVVGIAALVGALGRWRQGHLSLRPVALFAAVTMAAAYLSARLGAAIDDRTRLVLFTTVMILAAAAMWWRASRPPAAAPGGGEPAGSPLLLLPAGVVVGTLTGLVGVGGGFLIVPMLVGVLAMPLPVATATSLAVIALNTATAGVGWIGRVSLDPVLVAMVTAAALLGMVIGTRLAPRIAARHLTKAFAVLLMLVAAFTLWQTIFT